LTPKAAAEALALILEEVRHAPPPRRVVASTVSHAPTFGEAVD
jgi:hypothetical protein